MQEPFQAQRAKLPQQLGRAQRLGHGAHQVQLDTDRQTGREQLVARDTAQRQAGGGKGEKGWTER